MPSTEHYAVFIDINSDKGRLIDMLLEGNPPENFEELRGSKGMLFSPLALERFIDEENRHGSNILTADTGRSLRSMSSGERKKALLLHVLKRHPNFIILDNPFDNLDRHTVAELKILLNTVSQKMSMVQLVSRKSDLLPFIDRLFRLDRNILVPVRADKRAKAPEEADTFERKSDLIQIQDGKSGILSGKSEMGNGTFTMDIPLPVQSMDFEGEILIDLQGVDVSYGDRPILKNIDWTIKKGEFWELRGNNGSGKTTILSMITGENPKGYGQELYIFGRKKGSGESVWDIKKNIGYFTPAMTDQFTGYHSVEHMIVSGLTDSIGLYVHPTEVQLRLAKKWLQLIGLWEVRNRLFHDLSTGQKRLLMCARAMVKHPPLLIIDEATAGLDDASAELFVALVNKFAKQSSTTVIFVSHRDEPGLEPDSIYELEMTKEGSLGAILKM